MTTSPETLSKTLAKAVSGLLAGLLVLFMLYTAYVGPFESLIQRTLLVAIVTPLAVLWLPLGKGTRWRPLGLMFDVLGCLVALAASLYVLYQHNHIMDDLPEAEWWDVFLTVGLLVFMLEIARRTASVVFSILICVMLAYALFGQYISGAFGHAGFGIDHLTEVLFLSDRGFWGGLTGIAATTLGLFIVFGAFLLHTGAGQTFMDLAARTSGKSTGGAAKMAVVASALFGTVSGSAVANVATTGTFTIPLMKRLGYARGFAGAVEALASTGGQFTPPIMGAAAFVMAELLGISYWTIAVAAILPAALYYVGVFLSIHLISQARGYGRIVDSEVPPLSDVLNIKRVSPVLGAFGGLAYGIIRGLSIEYTVFLGIAAMTAAFLVVAIVERRSVRWVLERLALACRDSANGIITITFLLVCAQLFVGIVNLTGLGVTVTSSILASLGANKWLVAPVTAVICLIAGMGLPTSAAYVLVAAIFAPALIQIGIEPMVAHFFVLFYAAISVITPPVCIGVFVAASIAAERWIVVAWNAMKIGAVAYFLPLLFLAYPGLLLIGDGSAIALAVLTGLVVVVATAACLSGFRPLASIRGSQLLWLVPLALAALPSLESTLLGSSVLVLLMLSRRLSNGRPMSA